FALRDARDASPQAALRDADVLVELAQRVSRLGQRGRAAVAPDDLAVVVRRSLPVAGHLADDAEDPLPGLTEGLLVGLDLARQADLGSVQSLSGEVRDLTQEVRRRRLGGRGDGLLDLGQRIDVALELRAFEVMNADRLVALAVQ